MGENAKFIIVLFFISGIVLLGFSFVMARVLPEPPPLGDVLTFSEGWQPVAHRDGRIFVCVNSDGVYRYCSPIEE
jgi:hypothetical protein